MLTPGTVLQNRYRIASPLGQGGMGAVYRAWDLRLNIPVAVKEMVPQPGIDPHTLAQLRQQFYQEAQVLARLNHPNLVRVTDYFEEWGNAYLVMDFVEGQSLADRIAAQGPLPEAQVLDWACQLLDALAYCHAQGVVHRDIKPQNIIIRADGRPILVDFGLVKLWDPRDPRTRTVVRAMGTPEYAPPEQWGAGHTDPRSDLYSLGATLYHALTGQAPATATDRTARPSLFIPPRQLNLSIRPETERAILRAMELAQDARWGSAAEMAAALGGGEGGAVKSPPLEEQAKSKDHPQPGWGFWFLWVLATFVATVIIQAVFGISDNIGGFVLAGAIGGAVIGFAQWLVLRQQIDNAGWWILATLAGRAIGWAADWVTFSVVLRTITIMGVAERNTSIILADTASTIVSGALIGVAQWLVLRQQVHRAGWWVPATSASRMMGLTIFWILAERMDWTVARVMNEMTIGAVTGAVLIVLLRQHRSESMGTAQRSDSLPPTSPHLPQLSGREIDATPAPVAKPVQTALSSQPVRVTTGRSLPYAQAYPLSQSRETTCPRCGALNPPNAMNCRQCRINLEWARQAAARGESLPPFPSAELSPIQPPQPAQAMSEEPEARQENLLELGWKTWVGGVLSFAFFGAFIGATIGSLINGTASNILTGTGGGALFGLFGFRWSRWPGLRKWVQWILGWALVGAVIAAVASSPWEWTLFGAAGGVVTVALFWLLYLRNKKKDT
jgi:serine/threonine-protein kinase